jgi:hypothetical protein
LVCIEVDLVIDKGELVNYGYLPLCCCYISLAFESSTVPFITGLTVGALTETRGLLSCATRHCSGSRCPAYKPAGLVLAGDQHTLSTALMSVRRKCGSGVIVVGRSEGGVIVVLMQDFWALSLVLLGGMVLGIVIGTVGTAALPVDVELALADAVPYPIIPHIHCFGAALLDAVISNATGSAVVRDHQDRRLGVAKLFQGDSFGDSFFSIVEEPPELGFSVTGYSLAEDLGGDADGAVELGLWGVRVRWLVRVEWAGAQIMITWEAGSGLGLRQIGCTTKIKEKQKKY